MTNRLPCPVGFSGPLLLTVVLATVVTACGDDDPIAPPDLGQFPLGTFEVTLEEGDVSNPAIAGDWTITWVQDASYVVTFDGSTFIEGMFEVTGNQVTLTDISGPGQCPGPGTYEWAFDDPDLDLVEVSDACAGRDEVLTRKTWSLGAEGDGA